MERCVDQNPPMPDRKLRRRKDVSPFNHVRPGQTGGLFHQPPAERLVSRVPLGIRRPIGLRNLRFNQLSEFWVVVESMQRPLQLAGQRPGKRRFAGAACARHENVPDQGLRAGGHVL